MIKLVVKSLAIASITLVALLLWYLPTVVNSNGRTSAHKSPPIPTLDQIQALSVLTTLRADLSDVCELTIEGKTGKLTAVVIIRGNATLGIDLRQARFSTIDVNRRHAVLQLPNPTLQTVALDHQRTRVAALYSSGLWIIVPGGSQANAAVVEQCYRRGEQVVGEAARDKELIEEARLQAQRALTMLFAGLNWTVEFEWAAR